MLFSQQMYVEVEAETKDDALRIIYAVCDVIEAQDGVTNVDAAPPIEEAQP